MADYIIGDVQGCFDSFLALLKKIKFNPPHDQLHFAGDIINRGPRSLAMLQWMYQNSDHAQIVLGNHDIYSLGRLLGILDKKPDETIAELFDNDEKNRAIAWLSHQRLLINHKDFIIIHAGLFPGWTQNQIIELAAEAEALLKANPTKFLRIQFGQIPNPNDTEKKLQFAMRVLTTIRVIDRSTGKMKKYSGTLSNCPEHLCPWFEDTSFENWSKLTVFGHWAALGFHRHRNFVSIDTGCVWGRKLSAFDAGSQKLISVDSVEELRN